MPSFLVLGIYLLLLSDDDERARWNHFLHGGSVEDECDNYGINILTSVTWRLLFSDDDIKTEMVSPPWNNFLQCLLRFIVVRYGNDEQLGRLSFTSVFLILQWQKGGRHQKEKFLNSAYMNVSRRSLGIYSQVFCRVVACVVIHTAKRRTCLVLRSKAIHSVGTI